MDKQNSLTQFHELSSSELNQITGGDWWSKYINSIFKPIIRTAGDNQQRQS